MTFVTFCDFFCDFYKENDETANGIHRTLMNCLKKYDLDIKHITAYMADNANVNFGKHHSVYQLLNSANSRILKANCSSHIAHDTCKHACDQLSVDIESLYIVLSICLQKRGTVCIFCLC